LLAVPEEDRDPDARDVEAPGRDEREIVIEPAVAARADPRAHVVEQGRRELTGRDLAVGWAEQGLPHPDHVLGLRCQELLALTLHRGAVCLLALEDDAELLDVLLAHAGEEVEPFGVVWGNRGERGSRDDARRQE